MSTDWYLVQSKPRQERVAQMHLKRQNYHTYLPLMTVSRRMNCKYQLVIEPMFSRYLFIQLNDDNEDWRPIRSTRGVANLVQFGADAAKVSNDLIDYLKLRETQMNEVLSKTPKFSRGDSVLIDNGSFAGIEGVFQEASGGKRALILLQIAGHYSRVKVSMSDLALVA